MGSVLGGGGAKKAAKEQAKATREAARMQSIQNNYAAEASVQQMALAQQQRANSSAAADLLATPMESAEVDLSVTSNDADDGDLLRRRRTTRQTYQSDNRTGLNVR